MMPSIILKSDDAHPSMHPGRRRAVAICYMAPDGPVTTHCVTPFRPGRLPDGRRSPRQRDQVSVPKTSEALSNYETCSAQMKPNNELCTLGLILKWLRI